MIKLLIADDEPLVQIGLNSMLDWASLDIEVCGIASNGDAAYELIRQHHPEIVITDIQMPCSSGLDLVKRCRKEFGDLPVFIILTSHENFNYAKEAISCRVIDYLVKIDLSPETLTESINRALKQVASIQKRQEPSIRQTDRISDVSIMQERFFIRLLNNLFENETQCLTQAKELNLSFPYAGYVAAHLEMQLPGSSGTRLSQEQLLKLYNSTLHMLQELLGKYLPCRVIPLDTRRLAAIFYIQEETISTWKDHLSTALHQAFDMLFNYYSVKVLAGIGRLVTTSLELSVSYHDARQLSGSVSETDSFLYWDSMPNSTKLRNVFNLSLFRKEIAEAFKTLDETALHSVFSNICSLLGADQVHYAQALDAASSILHFTITLLPEGMEIASSIFSDQPDAYCSLYRQKTVPSILLWLRQLEEGLCRELPACRNTQKNYLVEHAKEYIREHLDERIVLQDIADTFNVSPNYLSQLFKKFENIGISEYISNLKIQKSQELLKDGNLKIYEIADQLGFESAFYFSKVFKKVTGISPKDFRNT